MFKLKTKYSPFVQLVSALVSLLVGFLFIVNYDFVWRFIINISLLLLFVYAFTNLVNIDLKKKKINISISFQFILAIFGFIYIYINPSSYVRLFPFIMGWYILLQAIARFFKFAVYLADKLKYKFFVLAEAIITLLFGIFLVIEPLQYLIYLSYYVGSYFIFYGLSDLLKALNKLVLSKDAHYAMPVPIIIATMLPKSTLNNILDITNVELEDKPSDLEIFIYLRADGFGQFGHMDFCYKNKTYSYGCFDPHNQKLMGSYGDGVLVVCDRDKFIKHGNVIKKATIIKFGLTLNQNQIDLIETRIEDMMARTIPHLSDAEIDEINNRLKTGPDAYDNYISNLYLTTKAKTYKFTKGKFKTYFVATTNCVDVVDEILQMKNLDLLNIKGILTPGTYLDFLNNEYLANSKIVTSRYVYPMEGDTNE